MHEWMDGWMDGWMDRQWRMNDARINERITSASMALGIYE